MCDAYKKLRLYFTFTTYQLIRFIDMLKIFGKTMNFKKLVSSRSYIYIKSSKYNLLSTKQVILGYWKVAVKLYLWPDK